MQAEDTAAAIVKGPASYFPSIERTYGRSIAEWMTIIRASPGVKHGALVTALKQTYGLGHGHATALVAHTLAADKPPMNARIK